MPNSRLCTVSPGMFILLVPKTGVVPSTKRTESVAPGTAAGTQFAGSDQSEFPGAPSVKS